MTCWLLFPLVQVIANNLSFRGYWYGTQRLLINALYLGQIVETTDIE